MKIFQTIFGFLLTALLLISFSYANAAGEATASETAKGGEKCACISSVGKSVGTLTIKEITVTDLFGNEKVLKPADYTVSGDGSTSPTITFNSPLAANSFVYVEMSTGRDGDHGYMKMSLNKGTSTRTGTRCNCP
jgi:hypothetical protein